jgi:hypothetical protein
MEQKRVFLYDASWRIIEERVDVDFDTNPGADWVSQHFWGLRYIDDLVAKRVDRDADGDWSDASQWYFITDSQFSVVAVLDHAKSLYDRIEYDAYGVARHRPSGDANGDGLFNSYDLASFSHLGGPGLADNRAAGRVDQRPVVRCGPGQLDRLRGVRVQPRTGGLQRAVPGVHAGAGAVEAERPDWVCGRV